MRNNSFHEQTRNKVKRKRSIPSPMKLLRRSSCSSLLAAAPPHEKTHSYGFMNDLMLVNKSRKANNLTPLERSNNLEVLAKRHAKFMAENGCTVCLWETALELESSVLCTADGHDDATTEFGSSSSVILGENEQCGESIKEMHLIGMRTPDIMKNILNPNCHKMGMGTAKGCDGKLYMCQLFR